MGRLSTPRGKFHGFILKIQITQFFLITISKGKPERSKISI